MSNFTFYNHRGNWQVTDELKLKIEETLGLNREVFRSCDFYFMKDSTTAYETRNKDQLKIFVGATPGQAVKENYFLTTDNGTYALEAMMVKSADYASPLLDDKNQIIGFYSEERSELYVPFVLDELDPTIYTDVILYALKQFKLNVLDEFINKDSWMKSKQLDVLKSRIIQQLSADKEARIRDTKERIKDLEHAIVDFTRRLKDRYDSVIQYRADLEKLESSEVNGLDNFVKGLDLIAEHPQVSNILVDKDVVTIYIDNVYAYAQVCGEERRYYIGNMHVKMNIGNTDIRFFGDNGRKGYWTSHDPHPHVNGGDGRACLGNVSATIAELCSQKEIYPLFLVCLDFLENANTEDPAGKKVRAWDEVDEDGNKVEPDYDVVNCERCDDEMDADNAYTVYTDFDSDDGELLAPELWCECCRENYASWVDRVEEAVCDEIYSDVEDWEEEGDEF